MAKRVSQKRQKEFDGIKKSIEISYSGFRDNVKRFNEFTNFVFNSSLDTKAKTVLKVTDKPKSNLTFSRRWSRSFEANSQSKCRP